jgi:hypothetical protein
VRRELGEVNALMRRSEERARAAEELAERLSTQVAQLEGTLHAQAASHAQELLLMQEEWSATEALMRQWEQALEARELDLMSKAEVTSHAPYALLPSPDMRVRQKRRREMAGRAGDDRPNRWWSASVRWGQAMMMKQRGEPQAATPADGAAALTEKALHEHIGTDSNGGLLARVTALDMQLVEAKARAAERAEVARTLQASNAELQGAYRGVRITPRVSLLDLPA